MPLAIGALLAMGAGPASAAPATDGSLAGTGLHIATGTLVDPVGRAWVSDHNAGFCRLTEPTDTAPGQLDHPAVPGAAGARTCLGGLLPDAQPGPDAAGQPTLVDPSPEFINSGDEFALIPDGASPSSEVVRARWNPDTKLFEYYDTITMNADRGRPVATSLGIDDKVYVTFQREATIQRIVDPAIPHEEGTPTVQTVAPTSDGRGAAAVAAGRDADGNLAVYVAETTGLRVLHPDAPNPATEASFDIPSALVDPEPAPATIGSLAYDDLKRTLWVGTSDAAAPADAGIDRLVAIDTTTGAMTDRAKGFSAIGGVAVRPDGEVDVVDDPALLDPAEPLGLGRRFLVGRAVAHVARGPLVNGVPAPDGKSSRVKAPTFEVSGDAGATLECRFSGPGFAGAAWQPCSADAPVEAGRELADGSYTLSVRATKDGIVGHPEAKAFVVDTGAPLRPRILKPADGSTVSGLPWYQFDAEELASFRCRFDDEADWSPCNPGRTRSFAAAGQHKLEIVAVDAAGNPSEASQLVTFSVDPDLPPTQATSLPDGPPRHTGSSLAADGLHIPTGAIVDPDGRTWVSDHNAGFCRLTDSDDNGAGRIDHPQLPGDPGPRTCLGGLLPEAGTGPDAAGAPALIDPTPGRFGSGDEVVLIPDGASPSSDVVRVKWNRNAGLFEYLDTVSTINTDGGRGNRPVAVSAIGTAAYVVFQRSGTVQRIANAASATPVLRIVGTTSDGRGAAAIAAGHDDLGRQTVYLAEGNGLTSLRPNAVTPPTARPSFALPPTQAVSALAYDGKTDQLWIGAADEVPVAGGDVVHRATIATGAVELDVAKGYSGIGGLAVRPEGYLLVFDDPALLDPAEPLGLGRMFVYGLPAAHLARGPLLGDGTEATDRAFVASRTPAFEVDVSEGTAECRLRSVGGSVDSGWAECSPDGRFTAMEPLAEGNYVLTVRAADRTLGITGLVERHRFTVDVTAPDKPSVTSPAEGVTVGATPWFTFDAEPGARFVCRWSDRAGFEPCAPGRTRPFADNVDNLGLEIKAIDRAGNQSVASDVRRFSARANVTKITLTGPQSPSRVNNATFTFSADAVEVQFGCRLLGTGEAFRACNEGSRSYTGLRDGTYTFEVRAMDAFGNVTPLTRRALVVDTTGPVFAVDVPAGATRLRSDVLKITSSENATWQCAFDTDALQDCGATVALGQLGDGVHTLTVVGRDALGNPATLTRSFVIAADGSPVDPGPVVEPTITVTTRGGQRLSIAVSAIDPTVDLAQIRSAGIAVEVVPARGLRLIRFRIYRAGGGQRRGGRTAAVAAASGKRAPMLTVFKRVPRKGGIVRLTRRDLRSLKPGRYVLELTPAKSRTRVGRPVRRTIRVVR